MSYTPGDDGPPIAELADYELADDEGESLLCHRGMWTRDWYYGERYDDAENAQYIMSCGTCGTAYRTEPLEPKEDTP